MSTDRGVVTPSERLHETFASGRFLLTAELESPRNASAANVERQARGYGPYVDAVNCTDNAAAIVRMSPVAAAAIATGSPCSPKRWARPRSVRPASSA